MYGYQESEELAPGAQGGKFGLNAGAFITKFEYNPNGGAGGAAQDVIDFTVQIGEKEFRHRFFPVSKVFAKGGGEITDTKSDEYKEAMAKETSQLNAMLTDIVKVFVDDATLRIALATPVSSFKNYAEVLQRLVQSVPNWQKVPVDVFLQYQWKPQGDNTRTFLELPKNVKHGIFIMKAQEGEFKEERTATYLRYVNAEGVQHPFKRGSWFLESAFANPVDLGGDSNSGGISGGNTTAAGW